jgi:uncharacterized protein YqhQ
MTVKNETNEAKEAREAAKKKRKRKIFWLHLRLRLIAAVLGVILFILVPSFIGALGYAVVKLTMMVWKGAN